MYQPQSNLEEKVNPSILKPQMIFTLIEPVLLDQSNKTSWVFPALKSTSSSSPQCLVDQIQVQRPIQIVATYQMSDHS